ncbi:MAG: N-acetyl-gamma-glutamyl-phosphate reductase [Candidatus Bipolaricaulota bacterium]
MTKAKRAAIVGGSGYTGGELVRILTNHPYIDLVGVTSRKNKGRSVTKIHPNLRDKSDLSFIHPEELPEEFSNLDLVFTALPHGRSMELMEDYLTLSDKIVDLSADFRLSEVEEYEKWYGIEHETPDLNDQFVYGLPEIHRSEIEEASYIASPGCTATAAIIPLYPIVSELGEGIVKIVVDSKVGSSAGGATENPGSHHPERTGVVRSYKPTGHRHTAEIEQELGKIVSFSPHGVEMVRGILSTIHVLFENGPGPGEVWKAFRKHYQDEEFVRFVNERKGIYRYPEPKLLNGTNTVEIGFELSKRDDRLVIMSAIDNLVKGAAGQAVQSSNLACGYPEKAGLERIGLHPI